MPSITERTTRLVLLLHLEHGRSADSVDAAMRKVIATLPDELRRSVTWDQRSLNGRPRKTLGYLTPSGAYTQFIAATA